MRLTEIKEAGNNNILKYAIKKGANIRTDNSLISIINAETFYLITLEDVNFLELFRLVQQYRNKIRILQEFKAEIPDPEILSKSFIGSPANDPNVTSVEIVQKSCESFMNIMAQMLSDEDIIKPGTARLFIPMLCRKFSVQLPISFGDFIRSFDEQFDLTKVFNEKYPNNLYEVCIDPGNDTFKGLITFAMMRSTSIAKSNKHFDTLVKFMKYNSLVKEETNKLYKTKLVAFSKFNPLNRDEIRCTMFNTTKESLEEGMKRMASISTPLKIDVAIQLPIQYMEILQYSYSQEELPISYEASMSEIISEGLIFNDFITPEENNESGETVIEEFNNSINAYKTRIAEASLLIYNSISALLTDPDKNDITSSFALLPSIFSTRAVITIDTTKMEMFTKQSDPLLGEMFKDIKEIAYSIISDISNRK